MGKGRKDAAGPDPRNLIRESYRIEGITESECRSIFLDWVLSLPDGEDAPSLIPELLALYGQSAPPTHPMTRLLSEGLGHWQGRRPRRRGGAKGRGRG